LSQSDPTDDALATIASILEYPEPLRDPERALAEGKPGLTARVEAEGYAKVGPGPMDSIRFKWTVRRENHDQYFVDETVGDDSRRVSTGPMPADAAIRFVDDQASEAQQQFEALRNEMAGRAAAAEILGEDGHES
jgi:hypothetical protein